ncbi:OmpA family protein [Massilia sp. erpn]|uniref:OmpA family protein n=1 Tax=Massilia sp. erpn TaxID=2738142 RepID=UPI002107E51D|nr:OmpA family protein [Massilia sp. erpn]UTY60373.1 OmpA family protein [Massilia sp. erpn]
MNKLLLKPATLILALGLAACSSTPTTTSLLDQARADFGAAQSSPAVAQYAQPELVQAGAALDQANAAAARRESLNEIDKLAYVAKQRTATAQEVAKAKSAEAGLADAARQRDQVRLQARTAEAEQAKRSAEQAQMQAANATAAQRDAQAQAERLAAQLADLQAKKTERGTIITFGDVLFNVDQSQLTAQGMAVARKLADVLQQNPERSVLVEGFTDSTGTAAHNLQLSQRRAEAVRAALVGMGIERSRVETRGYGEAYPVAGNGTSGDRQLNRRVEIVLSEANSPIAARR